MNRRGRQSGQDEQLDPVQSALDAKRRRIADLVKAAAAAVPAGVTTVIADVPVKPSNTPSFGFAAPPLPAGFRSAPPPSLPLHDKGNDESTQEHGSPASGSGGGLAALLGYSEEDSDEPDSPSVPPADASLQAASSKVAPAAQDDMDKELANFMSQLESSGLLLDEVGGALPADAKEQPAGQESASGHEQRSAGEGQGANAVSSSQNIESAAAAAAEAAAAVSVADADAPMDTGSEATGEAEQKVLGYLAQAPDWSKVLDTGGGGVYYWNLSTNEVVWEVPEGLDPDQLLPPDAGKEDGAAGAEAVKAQEQMQGQEQGQGQAGEGAAGAEVPSGVGAQNSEEVEGAGAAAEPQALQPAADAGVSGVERAGVGAAGQVHAASPGPAAVGAAASPSSTSEAEDGELEEGQLPLEANSDPRHQGQDKQQQPVDPAAGTAPVATAGGTSTLAAAAPAAAPLMAGSTAGAASAAAVGMGPAGPNYLSKQLLAPPQDHMTAVLESLAMDAAEAARCFMSALPKAVRLAVEAAIRHADWLELSAAQKLAVQAGRPEQGLSWEAYELHVSNKAMAALSALPAARKEAAALMARGAREASTSGSGAIVQQAHQAQRGGRAGTPPLPAAAESVQHDHSHKGPLQGTNQGPMHDNHGRHHSPRAPMPGHGPPGYSGSYMEYTRHEPYGTYNWHSHAHHYAAMQPYGYMGHPPGYYGHTGAPPLFPVAHGSGTLSGEWPPSAVTPPPADEGSPPPPPLPSTSTAEEWSAPQPPPLPPGASPTTSDNAAPQPPPDPNDDGQSQPPPPSLPPPPLPQEDRAADMAAPPAPPLPEDPSHAPLPDEHDMDLDMADAPVPFAAALPAPLPAAALNAEASQHRLPEAINFASQMLAAGASNASPAPAALRRKEYTAQASKAPAPTLATSSAAAPPPAASSAAAAATAAAAAMAADKKRKPDKTGVEATGTKKAKASKEVGGKVASLMNQWSSVRRSMEEEEERQARKEQEAFDPEVQQRKKRSEIEQWKAEHLRSGEAEENANFQPLQGDWRKRFAGQAAGGDAAGAKSRSKKAAAVSVAPKPAYPKKSTTRPDLEGLSKGLPTGWKATWKADTGDIYYENKSTKEVSWDRP